MVTKLFRRTALLMTILLIALIVFSASAYADSSDARYLMDAVTMSNGNIAVLFMKDASSNGRLFFGVYNPTNNDWNEMPVGETAPTAKEAALDVHDNKAHIAYITEEDKLAYLYQENEGWSDIILFSSANVTGSYKQDTLSCPDIDIDSNGKAHIVYVDTDGQYEDYGPSVMYATNESGNFKISAKSYIAIDNNEALIKPIKISVDDNEKLLSYTEFWKDYLDNLEEKYDLYSFYFDNLSGCRSEVSTNDSGKVVETVVDGEHGYTLVSEAGKYYVIDGTTKIAETEKAFSINAADMVIDESNLYYAAINGTSLLFYQNGTFVEDKVATTAISDHKIAVTVVSGGNQYLLYTGNDDENSLVISKLSNGEITEHLVSTKIETWDELQAALYKGGTITLTQDIIAENNDNTSALEVPAGKTVVLDLNGYILNRNLDNPKYGGEVIYVDEPGNLIINDSRPTATHLPEITYKDLTTNEDVVVDGGIITGGYEEECGGIVVRGNLTMHGGTITKNYSGGMPGAAGGVNVCWDGSFTMTGGSIVGNYVHNKDLRFRWRFSYRWNDYSKWKSNNCS